MGKMKTLTQELPLWDQITNRRGNSYGEVVMTVKQLLSASGSGPISQRTANAICEVCCGSYHCDIARIWQLTMEASAMYLPGNQLTKKNILTKFVLSLVGS